MTITLGTLLGSYEITGRIGAGGMGEVWRARDARIGRDVAVKVLPEAFAGNEDRVRRFEQEARAAGTLNHPGLVTIFDVGAVDGSPYIVMELLDGETLRDALGSEHGSLPLRKAVDFASQIASALAVAHEKGIIHRDLKPENIFVTSEGRVKILDFGLAKLAAGEPRGDQSRTEQRQTSPGTVMGTAGYMAPEQVRAQRIDERADIFSFGAILYEMLSGRRAFRQDSAVETMNAILKEDPPELTSIDPKLPTALEHIVRHCLEKNPRERFQSARDLAFQLRTLQDLSGSAIGTVAPPKERRRYLIAAAAAAVLAMLTAGAFLLFRAPSGAADFRGRSFHQLTFAEGVELYPSLSPDGKIFAYVSRQSGNDDIYVQRVDGRNSINLTKDSPANDFAPAFSPDGSQIAFRSERNGGGVFVMGATGESVRRLTDFGHNPTWSPDGRRIVIATEITAMHPRSRNTISELWIIDARTGEKRPLLQGRDAVQPSWSPNGKRIAFWGVAGRGGDRDIFTVEVDVKEPAKTVLQVTTDAVLDWNPVWSPDGKHLYFGSDRDGTLNLWRIAIDQSSGKTRGAPEPMPLPGGYTGHYTLSLQGEIAFVATARTDRIVAIPLDIEGGKLGSPRPSVGGSIQLYSMEASPDGESIAFSTTGAQEDLFVARADGSDVRQLTNDASRDRGPAWSADGKSLFFYSNRGGSFDFWKINADGSGLTALKATANAPQAMTAMWYPRPSPDGRKLAGYNGTAAAIVHLDRPVGQRLELLPPIGHGRHANRLRWSPDGRMLVAGISDVRSADYEGIVLYKPESRRYELISESGGWPRFIDSHRIAFFEDESVVILDLRTRERKKTKLPPGMTSDRNAAPDVSRDGSMVYLGMREEQGNVWLMRPGRVD